MEKFKKLILKISADKGIFFVKMFITTIVLSIACFVLVFMFIDKNPGPASIANFESYQYAHLINLGIGIVWLTFFLIMISVYLIIAFKVTCFNYDPRRTIILHYKDNKNKAEFYSHPIWEKRNYSIVYFPPSWDCALREDTEKEFNFRFDLTFDEEFGDEDLLGIYGTDLVISFPISLKFHFNNYLHMKDLEKMVRNDAGDALEPGLVNIEDYLKEYFISYNSNAEKIEVIKESAAKFHKGKISSKHLAVIAANNLSYPPKIFSNVEKTDMSVHLGSIHVVVRSLPEITSNTGF